jgi:arylsulfatase A-like enzyme
MAKTLQELGINEVLVENVPLSPVDSGNGTHGSDSEGDKDFAMDESSDSSESEEEEKTKKNVKTGKNSGKRLKMWQIKTPFADRIKEAKRQRAIQARKNRERSNLNKQSH